MIGTAPNSLINTIDTADLIKKGQKEAAVMFSCLVAPTGQVVTSGAYRGTRGSELLEQELLKRLATAKFIPAVHNHQPVIAVFYGTVKFAVVNGKPRLRIFANQQLNEVDKESDFIDPQPYVGQDSKFTGLHYPETGSTVAVTGVVELALNVDAKGNLTNLQVLSEEPPLLGFGDAALSDFSGAKFIPAFRNGQPVESNVKIPVYYKPSAELRAIRAERVGVGLMNKVVRASFFKRDPLTCARELIGTELIWGECSGVVVEVEAYAAIDDEAAHTFTRPSARSFIERNKAGAAYVYFNYGVHWMLNVLVKGDANGFVLIRALEPRRGVELMKRRRGVNDLRQLCSGPGKLTQAFAVTGRDHEMDLCSDPRHCFVSNSSATFDVVADKRIGISRSAHLPWRFTLRGSPFVSRAVKL